MLGELDDKTINSKYFSCYEDRFKDTDKIFYVVNRKDDFNSDGEFFESFKEAKRYITKQTTEIILLRKK